MRTKLSIQQQAFFEEVDRLLWEEWDPLGVNESLEARDEYSSLVPLVFARAIEGQSEMAISDFLSTMLREQFELVPNQIQNVAIAKKVLSAKAANGL